MGPKYAATLSEQAVTFPEAPVHPELSAVSVPVAPSRRHRVVRAVVVGVLIADVAGLSLAAGLSAHHLMDQPVAPSRGRIVDARCVDGYVDLSIDDASPAGLLAQDTRVVC